MSCPIADDDVVLIEGGSIDGSLVGRVLAVVELARIERTPDGAEDATIADYLVRGFTDAAAVIVPWKGTSYRVLSLLRKDVYWFTPTGERLQLARFVTPRRLAHGGAQIWN